MAEQMIEVNGVELCTEAFGDPTAPPILLIMGIGASMLWWDDGLCELLADAGRYVIRYDHRDTGRSVSYEPGRPGYRGGDLADDTARVLNGHGLDAAHVVGVSAGGAFAQVLALDHPDRVLSLVLISTTAAVPGDRDLPGPTDEFVEFVSTATVDWSDIDSVVEYQVGYSRVLNGIDREFDDDAVRRFVRRDLGRTRNVASLQNHDLVAGEGDGSHAPMSSISAPTLVVHGTADPMFPLPHGEALAAAIDGATLLTLAGAGHGVFEPDWPMIVPAIIEHTR